MRSKAIPLLTSCYEEKNNPTDCDRAEKFSSFFSNVAGDIREISIHNNEKTIFIQEVTEFEVLETVSKLENKTSSGIDEVNNILVKVSKEITSRFLSRLITLSFSNGKFPDVLKISKVVPIHKTGSKLDENN